MEDMKGSPVTPAKVIDGVEYSASVQGSTNPKPDKGAIPNAPAAAFKLTAKQNAKVTFVTGSAAKTYHFIKVDSTGSNSYKMGRRCASGYIKGRSECY